jgi:hypothetical protein
MKKTWILLILLLTVCSACQTETPVPPSPTPNRFAEDVLLDFCDAFVEGNLENALELVTEDIEIIFAAEQGDGYYDRYEGYDGVEEMLNYYAENEVYDCTVRRIDINGDEVTFWWTHYSPCMGFTCTASCYSNTTMQGKQIQKIDNDCAYEFWPKDTN